MRASNGNACCARNNLPNTATLIFMPEFLIRAICVIRGLVILFVFIRVHSWLNARRGD